MHWTDHSPKSIVIDGGNVTGVLQLAALLAALREEDLVSKMISSEMTYLKRHGNLRWVGYISHLKSLGLGMRTEKTAECVAFWLEPKTHGLFHDITMKDGPLRS